MEIQETPLHTFHLLRNQSVERHVKLLSETSLAVASCEKQDGLICQKIQLKRMMKKFNSKQ